MSNLYNQSGVRAAIHTDGYTISVLVTSPPIYMMVDTRSRSITGRSISNIAPNLHGYCMDFIPDVNIPVVCAGSVNGTYTTACFGLTPGSNSPTVYTNLPVPQDGCTLVGYKSGFLYIPGYLVNYRTSPPMASTPNPAMGFYDMSRRAWSAVLSSQFDIILRTRMYAFATVMPGTNATILYGGSALDSTRYSDIHIFDLISKTWLSSLSPVQDQYLRSPSSSSSSGSTSQPSLDDSFSSEGNSTRIGIIAGGIGAGIVLIALIAGTALRNRRSTYQPACDTTALQKYDAYNETPQERERIRTVQSYEGHVQGEEPLQVRSPQAIV
ncbi:hypothetical protein EDD11_002058 [Mortierella claussenii]|nr:hypothetical protein EDD11_002058 [Mortierella claussenii]